MIVNDYVKIFKKNEEINNYDEMIKGALECLDKFGKYFEKEDLQGMDSCFHFPHYILSGNEVICWNEGGKLPLTFFTDLKKLGFKRTVVTCREVITVAENKVHFKYCYYRESKDGKVLSQHDNIWIVTLKDGKWGIQIRSY